MPKRTVKELLADFFSVDIALGSVSKMEQTVSKVVAAPVEEVRRAIREQDVVHQDETGWFEAPADGRKARAWLWVAVSAAVTVFKIARSRGAKVAKEMLGEDFGGFLVVDRWSAYLWKPRGMRQVCWAHLVRDFRSFVERGGLGARIGEQLLDPGEAHVPLLAPHPGWALTRATFQRRMKKVERSVGRLLRKAAVCSDAKTEGMAKEILKHEPALFTFVLATGVEPTNNVAERALRGAAIWRKISFGTDSENGGRLVERILTVVATLKQQRRHVLAYLTTACEASLHRQSAPSLLPSR